MKEQKSNGSCQISGKAKEIREHLFDIADAKYKEFHSGLVPGNDTIIGVRVPVLRAYAKELLKEEKAERLLEIIADGYYEEIMLQGMVIGLQPKPDYETVMQQVREFVPKIDNWAVCDIFCGGLKIAGKHKEELRPVLEEYLESGKEFERRFAVVMLLDYYIEETYLDWMFEHFDRMNREGYYVQMAVAWAVSVCLVKAYEKTCAWLAHCQLDDFTYNKALQKACESYRLDGQQKDALRKKKRKTQKNERKV